MKQTLLSLLMMLLPLMAHAEAVEIDGIYYNLITKGKVAEVTQNPNKYTGNVVIPSSVVYNDVTYSVTSIGNEAFRKCYDLTSITIPNSVTAIGNSAFGGCVGLTSITIPNSVTSIGQYTFDSCSGLTSITIPNSVTSIGNYAFNGCSSLTSVTIPNSVTSIGNYAFNGCSSLTSITIPNSVKSIGAHAFAGCSSLTSITIPNSVTSIGEYAFSHCSGLTTITIPNSVTSIGNYAFWDCSGLTSIIIPNSVTSIGLGAFAGCSGLTSIVVESGSAVYDSRNNCNAIIKSESNTLIGGCNKTLIPNSITSIGDQAFLNCIGLISVTIPNSVTTIGSYAFSCCSDLTSIIIPNSVTSIGEYAFSYYSGLTTITIPNSVTYIGRGAFAGCSHLEDVYCYATTVPSTSKDAFNDSYFRYATLHIPASAMYDYKSKEPWSLFKEIVAIESQKYSLKYMVDGTLYKEYSMEEGAAITPEPAPTKQGYTFSGWSSIPATMPANDVTVTGTFTKNAPSY